MKCVVIVILVNLLGNLFFVEASSGNYEEAGGVRKYRFRLEDVGISETDEESIVNLLSQHKSTEDFFKKDSTVAHKVEKHSKADDSYLQKRQNPGGILIKKGNQSSSKINLHPFEINPPIFYGPNNDYMRQPRKINEENVTLDTNDLVPPKTNKSVVYFVNNAGVNSSSNSSNATTLTANQTDPDTVYQSTDRNISPHSTFEETSTLTAVTKKPSVLGILKDFTLMPAIIHLNNNDTGNQSSVNDKTADESQASTGNVTADNNELVSEAANSSEVSSNIVPSNNDHDERTVTGSTTILKSTGRGTVASMEHTTNELTSLNTINISSVSSDNDVSTNSSTTEILEKATPYSTFVSRGETTTASTTVRNVKNNEDGRIQEVKKEIAKSMGGLTSASIAAACIGIGAFVCGVILVCVGKRQKGSRERGQDSYTSFDEV